MSAPSAPPDLHGILVIDKPLGMTSMRVVERVRYRAGKARTGHAGTLDPLATGVLVVAIGRATKSIDRLMAGEKRYDTVIDLGAFTTTDDSEGERTEIASAPPSPESIREACGRWVGEVMQRPPAFSAIKVQGRRSYDLARSGEARELAARPVMIHGIEIDAYDFPMLSLRVHCGKGTYIRSLARDLGMALGTGGHCRSIRRTQVGPYLIDAAVSMDALPERVTQAMLLPAPA
ncbi:MAG: tRNA pseudouridine synthase [Planctomycetota bacterium]|jgi:tRNA pseudouridine55 synthase